MSQPFRLLQINGSAIEAERIVSLLSAGGIDVDSRRIATAGELPAALAAQAWQVVIADLATLQSGFAGLLAESEWLAPGSSLIVIGDQADEEALAAMMRAGARDFLRTGDLARLPAIVARELERARARLLRDQTAAEEALREGE